MATIHKSSQYIFTITKAEFERLRIICEEIGDHLTNADELWAEFDAITDILLIKEPRAQEQLSDSLLIYFDYGFCDFLEIARMTGIVEIIMQTSRKEVKS